MQPGRWPLIAVYNLNHSSSNPGQIYWAMSDIAIQAPGWRNIYANELRLLCFGWANHLPIVLQRICKTIKAFLRNKYFSDYHFGCLTSCKLLRLGSILLKQIIINTASDEEFWNLMQIHST